MEVAATSNAAITPHATIGELPRQELDFDETDCSNPQQGPGSAASRLGSTCMAQSPPTTSVGVVPGRVTSPLTTGESDDRSAATKRSAQEDDVGRHQAASCEARAAVRFSATMKDNRKLFVGGLPMDVTLDEFHTFFKQFGTVMDSVVMFDRETRKPRGFGFVTFEDVNVCHRLLQNGELENEHSLHEEKGGEDSDAVNAACQRSGRLSMRGKIIEVKAAQPKSPLSRSQPNHKHPPHQFDEAPYGSADVPATVHAMDSRFQHHQSQHHMYGYELYDLAAKHPATLPHLHYPASIYGFAAPPTPVPYAFVAPPTPVPCAFVTPPTPVPYFADPMTPMTPQAMIDMAHHMLFYSHLLATPSLMSPLISPMMSPMMSSMMSPMMSPMVSGCNHPHHFSQQYHPYSHMYHNAQVPATPAPPVVPDVTKLPAVSKVPQAGKPFRIGGATFYPEKGPPSPTMQPVKSSRTVSQEQGSGVLGTPEAAM